MLAVLAAVTEVIKQNGGTESSTEYYAALVSDTEKNNYNCAMKHGCSNKYNLFFQDDNFRKC